MLTGQIEQLDRFTGSVVSYFREKGNAALKGRREKLEELRSAGNGRCSICSDVMCNFNSDPCGRGRPEDLSEGARRTHCGGTGEGKRARNLRGAGCRKGGHSPLPVDSNGIQLAGLKEERGQLLLLLAEQKEKYENVKAMVAEELASTLQKGAELSADAQVAEEKVTKLNREIAQAEKQLADKKEEALRKRRALFSLS